MKYKIFNTTDEQSLLLESGDTIRTEVIVDSGKLSIKIQKIVIPRFMKEMI